MLYRSAVATRRALYQHGFLTITQLPVPVVVVGNVVVGGAGKTPTVLALLAHLKAQGWYPGVVSRGYGRHHAARTGGALPVQAEAHADAVGDEPLLIARVAQVPVFVASRRADAAHALLAAHPQVNVIVCDDGLQHWALARDLSVVVFDARGVGNGWLLPAGLLREPWPPRPGAAFAPHAVLHQLAAPETTARAPSSANLPSFTALRRLSELATNALGETQPLQQLAQQPLTAMAGIAKPDGFFDMLRQQGVRPETSLALPDHAPTALYAEAVHRTLRPIVCTEKDAVKLFPLAVSMGVAQAQNVWAVPLELELDDSFLAFVDQRLAAHRALP